MYLTDMFKLSMYANNSLTFVVGQFKMVTKANEKLVNKNDNNSINCSDSELKYVVEVIHITCL